MQDHAAAIFWVIIVVSVLMWVSHLLHAKFNLQASADSSAPAGFTCGCSHDDLRNDWALVPEVVPQEEFVDGDPQKRPFGSLDIDSKHMGDLKDITGHLKAFDKPILGNPFVVPLVKDMPGEKEPAPIPQTMKLKDWTYTKNNEAIRKAYKKYVYNIVGPLFTTSTHGSKTACAVYFVPKGKGTLSDEAAMASIRTALSSGIESLQNKLYALTNGHFALRKVYAAVCEVDMDGTYSPYKGSAKPYDLRNPKLSGISNRPALQAAAQWVADKLNWNDPDIFTYIMSGSPGISDGMLDAPAGKGGYGTFTSDAVNTIFIKGRYVSDQSNVLTHEFLHNLGLEHSTEQGSIMRQSDRVGTSLGPLLMYQLGCMKRVKYVSIDSLSSAGGSVTVASIDLPDARDACAILYVPVFVLHKDSSHSDWVPHALGSLNRRGGQIQVCLYANGTMNVFDAARIPAGGNKVLTLKKIPPHSNLNNFVTTPDVVNVTLGLRPRPASVSFKVQVNGDYSVTLSAA